jgi:hypothetical protein
MPTAVDKAEQFLRKMDTGWSDRRLLEEIGKLSCDELAAVLLVWNRERMEASHVAD